MDGRSSLDVQMVNSIQFVNETDNILAEGVPTESRQFEDEGSSSDEQDWEGPPKPKPGKRTRGRVKIKMEYIKNKIRRYTTFSKRKTGIMKKAYELASLTGTQVMLLVASETGHVYTFATKKLQPMIMSSRGKALIEACLSSPDVQLTFNGNPESSDLQSSSFNDIETTPINRKRKIVPDDSEQLQYFYDPEDDSNIQARVSVGNVDRGTSGITESLAVNASSLQSAKSQLVLDYNTGAPVVVQFPLTNVPRTAPTNNIPIAPKQVLYQLVGTNQIISIPTGDSAKLLDSSEQTRLGSIQFDERISYINPADTSSSGNTGTVLYQHLHRQQQQQQSQQHQPLQHLVITSTGLIQDGHLINVQNMPNLTQDSQQLDRTARLLAVPVSLSNSFNNSQIVQTIVPDSSVINSIFISGLDKDA